MEKTDIGSVLLEKTAEIVITFDEQGNILYGNQSALDKLDYTQEELKTCNMSKIFGQEFQQENGTYAPFACERLSEKEEAVMYRKNSSCFSVSLHIFDMGNKNFFLIANDITWQKNIDVRDRRVFQEEQTNRRIRNEFIANVTHELRTPINGIKGHVTTLLDEAQDEKQKKTLEIILYCCDNMSAIINNILDFSKIEAGKFILEEAEFDFYQMMDQVLDTHMAEISKKELGIHLYIDENIPQFLIGDSLRINQILNNFLSNAVKFTHLGHISVDVSKTLQVNDEIELFFMVRDTGIGISKEEQDKLFQSFRQVDASITRQYGGTGLGLSIAKQLVEMMNGSVYVESEKGKGSCFSFNIKLHTNGKDTESRDISKTMEKWNHLIDGMEQEEGVDFLTFGTPENEAELKKRMEKLVLSIELGSWEKAELYASTMKDLIDENNPEMKRALLRLEMAIRKEDYTKSLAAYDKVKEILENIEKKND